LRPLGWSAQQVEEFLQMQFRAQHSHYQEHYPDASFEVLLVDGEPAGRLYVRRSPGVVHVVDIALLPAFRGRGIGTALLTGLHEEASAAGGVVSIHMERQNPAMTLYRRLGFEHVSEAGPYVLMEWR
jgi:ribosomal protein S18 acetylase RimI-like enzyme